MADIINDRKEINEAIVAGDMALNSLYAAQEKLNSASNWGFADLFGGGVIGREPDGSFNEDYCKWCYADGVFAYQSKEQLLDFLLAHMPNPENTPAAERRTQYDAYLSQLKHWK